MQLRTWLALCYLECCEGLEMLFYDYNKRNYLLPPGCKDLIDLLKLEQQRAPFISELGEELTPEATQFFTTWKLPQAGKQKAKGSSETSPQPPASFREIEIPAKIAVSTLAELLGKKPFHIIADLMTIGVFATIHAEVPFEAAAKILRNYGLLAKKMGT